MKKSILKEANMLTLNIINKYFSLPEINPTNDEYVNVYNKMFCLVPVYISPNKETSERLLYGYKKLTKTIWPSITLLQHNIRGFPDQEIDSDDEDIKDYDKTLELYHSDKIIKKGKLIMQ